MSSEKHDLINDLNDVKTTSQCMLLENLALVARADGLAIMDGMGRGKQE